MWGAGAELLEVLVMVRAHFMVVWDSFWGGGFSRD